MKSWNYRILQALKDELAAEGLSLPLGESYGALEAPLALGGKRCANRLAVQPMEGCDASPTGAPEALTFRRYERFAQGGAGLIWLEANAVAPEARANPRQLMLTSNNLSDFKRLTDSTREAGLKRNGYAPLLVLQATHSGRYSRPEGKPQPLIAYACPPLEDAPLPQSCILSDEYLAALPERFANTARLAQEAGFDGVDVKACHRYLFSELLSAFNRPGRFGGSFENRTRLLLDCVRAAQAAVTGDMLVVSRLNLYDGFAWPNGWGMKQGGGLEADLTEPIRLLHILADELHMPLVDLTLGNPYRNPHVNRPYNCGGYEPPEEPLAGVARAFSLIAQAKKAVPGVKVVSSAVSYLRQFSGNAAAGLVAEGGADMVGFGRMAFAYPDFARDLLSGKGMDASRCCVTCGKCTELMRMGAKAGCVVRDTEVYLPLYQEGKKGSK